MLGAAASASAATGATGTTGVTGSTGATGATGPSAAPDAARSANWAGYAVSGADGVVRHFAHAGGSWIEPAVTCAPGSASYSAFWVGLGGLSPSSHHLEQTGTEADCDSHGVAHYSAWYELVPAGPVTVRLSVAAGDLIHASVAVADGRVTLTVADLTRGTKVTEHRRGPHADTTSAEWIAEAPSNCRDSSCRPLRLSDFGDITFTNATARIRDGTRGTIVAPQWSARAIELGDAFGGAISPTQFGPRELVTAVPSVLGAAGSSFGVAWAAQPSSASDT
jgi:hypothetical protein